MNNKTVPRKLYRGVTETLREYDEIVLEYYKQMRGEKAVEQYLLQQEAETKINKLINDYITRKESADISGDLKKYIITEYEELKECLIELFHQLCNSNDICTGLKWYYYDYWGMMEEYTNLEQGNWTRKYSDDTKIVYIKNKSAPTETGGTQ